jgi:hypothetical protein
MRSIRSIGILLVLVLIVASTPNEVSAQSITSGAQIAYDTEFEAVGLGGQARFGVNLERYAIVLNPSAEYYFLDDVPDASESLFNINLDVLFEFGDDQANARPYAGAGLGVSFYSADYNLPGAQVDDTQAGLNLVGGASFNTRRSVRPFAQGTLTISDGSRFSIKGGVLVLMR